MDPTPLVPPGAPQWWGTLAFLLLLAMQLFKVFAKSAPWWSAAMARVVAVLAGVVATIAVAPAEAWLVDAVSGLAVGLASIAGYDLMALSDSGIRRIGPAILLCLAVPYLGCGGAPIVEPVAIGGYGHIDAVFRVGGVTVRARIVAGAEAASLVGLTGFGRGCVAVGQGEFTCWVFADECQRDPVTGLCMAADDSTADEQ